MKEKIKDFAHRYLVLPAVKTFCPKDYHFKQLRSPRGWFGRHVLAPGFKSHHQGLTDFMIQVAQIQETDHILDIGFGSGWVFKSYLSLSTKGKIYGLEASKEMLEISKRSLKVELKSQRLKLTLGTLSQLPYRSHSMTKIFTANTLYFWQDPIHDAKELFRVLEPGGKLLIGFRSKSEMKDKKGSLFTLYSPDEVEALLNDSGFISIQSHQYREGSKTYYCCIAQKPLDVV